MKLFRLPLLAAAAVACSVHAEVLQDWTFDDAGVVPLSKVANAVSGGATFSADFEASTTNGRGQFVVKRPTGGVANSFASITNISGRNAVPHWLVVRVVGWSFSGTSKNETIRIGFTTNTHAEKPATVAVLKINNTEGGKVAVGVDALGEGGESLGPLEIFSSPHSVPTTFAMKYDPVANTHELWISIDDGATFQKAGEGKTSPERTARNLRVGFAGGFNLRQDVFIIDRITVQTHSPIPGQE